MRAGGQYYPKLLSAVPFTPVSGPRLLAAQPDHRQILAQSIAQLAQNLGFSSAHANFVSPQDKELFTRAGYLLRVGEQFHWQNKDYADFDEFLAALSSRKRKAIKRERRCVADNDLSVSVLRGDDIKPHHWDAFWTFYQDTGARKWGTPYLTRAFFDLAQQSMGDQLLLFLAMRDERPIAGALNFVGADTTLWSLLGLC